MKKHIFSIISATAFYLAAGTATALPIADNSVINIAQFDFVNPTHSSISTNSNHSNTFVSTADVQAYGDLTTGKVGTRVNGSDGGYSQSIVSMFDTLSFNTGGVTPVEVSFDLNYDGSLASSSIYDHPRSDSTVRIFDITGLSTWLETESVFNMVETVAEASLLTWKRLSFNLDSLAHDGTLFDFDSTVTGSFMADPTKTYGIQLSSNSFAESNAMADFLGTSTFQFTNLNGATVSSGSGVFLSNQVATSVPEPSSILLFSIGVIGLIGMNKKKPKINRLSA